MVLKSNVAPRLKWMGQVGREKVFLVDYLTWQAFVDLLAKATKHKGSVTIFTENEKEKAKKAAQTCAAKQFIASASGVTPAEAQVGELTKELEASDSKRSASFAGVSEDDRMKIKGNPVKKVKIEPNSTPRLGPGTTIVLSSDPISPSKVFLLGHYIMPIKKEPVTPGKFSGGKPIITIDISSDGSSSPDKKLDLTLFPCLVKLNSEAMDRVNGLKNKNHAAPDEEEDQEEDLLQDKELQPEDKYPRESIMSPEF
ncbi:uncharacterized protein MELLADRAFT_61265 [Melampsora larici-populina 98AG31]|uniref:Uncharacterized protein n=1 Tax=Melampsora larici-populina (strain 98AG31 / pathotype 3-4-7) TaxID=747676 RepID=F4RE88_MELLP|nr:uncharacterized protein MELLADRAFT_61265 [Melampsora larici-populina 98AG31]EGG09315.1 hypothetical protein MELLADRAFT_61265 [Melampsora larici-populina 98AG31]